MPATTAEAESPPSETAPARPQRRWRRRLLVLGFVTLIGVAAAWVGRLTIAEVAIQQILPSSLGSALSMEAAVDGVEIREDSSGLLLTIDQITLDGAEGSARARGIAVTLDSLFGPVSDPLGALESVHVDEATWTATGERSEATVPRVPNVVLSEEKVPADVGRAIAEWQINITSFRYEGLEQTISGAATLVDGLLEVNATVAPPAATPNDPAERESGAPWGAALRARVAPTGLEDIQILGSGFRGAGSFVHSGDCWRASGTFSSDTISAELTCDVPTTAEQQLRATIQTRFPQQDATGNFEVTVQTPDADLSGVIKSASGSLEIRGSVDPESAEVTATFVDFDGGSFLAPWLPRDTRVEAPIAGELRCSLASWSPGVPEIHARLEGAGPVRWTAPGVEEALTDLQIHGTFGSGGVRVERLRLSGLDGAARIGASILPEEGATESGKHLVVATVDVGEGSLAVRGTLDGDRPDVQVTLQSVDVGALARHFAPAAPWRGVFDGNAEVTGTLAAPIVTATLTSESGTLAVQGKPLEYQKLHAALDASSQSVELKEVRVEALTGSIRAIGSVPLVDSGEWDAGLRFDAIDVAGLRPWTSAFRELRGQISGRAQVRGRRWEPTATAECQLREGEFAFAGWERLRDVAANFSYDDDVIRFEDVRADAGGGAVTGSGTVDLKGARPTVRAALDVERVILVRSPDLAMRVSGSVRLEGDAQASTLNGELEVIRGIYRRNYYPQLRGSGPAMSFDLFTLGGFFSNTQLDLALALRGGFRIDNNRLELVPRGQLRLRGTGQVPYLAGQVSASDGKLRLPHLTVGISYAELLFPDADPYRPRLQFHGAGSIRDYDISVTSRGTLSDLEVEFRSIPELPDEELLVLIATGRFPKDLAENGAERTAATELALLYGPQVWEWIFGQGGESVLDDITISAENAERDDATDRITVEWRLRDGVSVVGEQDHRGDVNLDLRFFWWFP